MAVGAHFPRPMHVKARRGVDACAGHRIEQRAWKCEGRNTERRFASARRVQPILFDSCDLYTRGTCVRGAFRVWGPLSTDAARLEGRMPMRWMMWMGTGSLVVAAMALAPSNAHAQQDVACGTNAQTIVGASGHTVVVRCPAGCGSATAWGTGTYSDDSSICTAAIHAGVIPAGAGGEVSVTIADGLPSYPPSTANGVTTSSWGSWGRSFTVAATGGVSTISCAMNAQGVPADTTVVCPPGCGTSTAWGEDVYSDDSSICTAAIHAGVIQAATGGPVHVTIAPGQSAYPATSRNGVTTSSWGAWGRSFHVAAP
jgi:hypothetical protein